MASEQAPSATSPASPLVLTDIADGVGTLTLNNPDERNTLTAPMVAEIIAAMEAFEADETVGAIVVTGTPPRSAPAPTSATSPRRPATVSAPSTKGSCASPAVRCRRSRP